MAILATETFPGSSGAAWPGQWTTGVASTGVVNQDGSGHGVLSSGSASSFYYGDFAYLSGITASRDVDVTLDVTFPAATEGYFVIQLRCASPTATGGASNSYYIQMDPSRASGVSMDVGKVVSGAQTHLANFTVGPAWSAGTAQRIRFQAIANTVQVKWWAPGSAEPGSWNYTTTDTSLSAATGSVAFQMVNGAAGTSRTVQLSNVTVTNGTASATGTASLSGAGTLAASGASAGTGSASFSGSGTLAASATALSGSASFSGSGSLVASATLGAMQAWQNALAARNTAPATALFVGVSLTEGQGSSTKAGRWVDRVLTQLRAAYPTSGVTGGVGYLPAWYAVYGPNSTWQPYTSRTGTHANDTGAYGPGRRTDTMSAGATLTYTITGDIADLCWIGGTGSFTYSVDGGAATTVSTSATAGSMNITRATLGTAASHTLTITAVSTVHFAGVMVYNGDAFSGIRFIESGHVGFLSSDFANMSNTWLVTNPDLVVINLGANDPGSGISAATMQANIRALITDIRSAVSKPLSVALLVYDWAAQPTYRAAYDAIVAADPTVALIDLHSSVTSLTSDGHPDDTGQVQVAAGVTPALGLNTVVTAALSGGGTLTASPSAIIADSASSSGEGTVVIVGDTPTKRYGFRVPFRQRYMPFLPALPVLMNYSPALLLIQGQWVETEYPSEDQINAASLYFPGGYELSVDHDTAVTLIRGGFTVDGWDEVLPTDSTLGIAVVGTSTVGGADPIG